LLKVKIEKATKNVCKVKVLGVYGKWWCQFFIVSDGILSNNSTGRGSNLLLINQLQQQFWFVRGDIIQALFQQPSHGGLVVDCPGINGQA